MLRLVLQHKVLHKPQQLQQHRQQLAAAAARSTATGQQQHCSAVAGAPAAVMLQQHLQDKRQASTAATAAVKDVSMHQQWLAASVPFAECSKCCRSYQSRQALLQAATTAATAVLLRLQESPQQQHQRPAISVA
jgi:hypothetical protein